MDLFYEIIIYKYKLYYEYKTVGEIITLVLPWRKKVKYVRFGKLFSR